MINLELLFFMQCLLGILMMIFLHKINRMKKQVDDITKEVKAYLTCIEEEIKDEPLPVQTEKTEKTKKTVKISKDEAENSLIQAVLQEYFP